MYTIGGIWEDNELGNTCHLGNDLDQIRYLDGNEHTQYHQHKQPFGQSKEDHMRNIQQE
jgi:hypothetical protein